VADPARLASAAAAVRLAARFPDLPLVEPDTARLSGADARLCTAIHRHSLQRWLTIEAVLQGALRQPVAKLDPVVRGVMVNAGAQLLFMDRLPAYAVIDGAVSLTRKLDRRNATGLVNAALRKVAGFVVGHEDGPWAPAADALPWPGGEHDTTRVVRLARALLPKPDNLLAHLSVAASLPLPLLQRWFALFGRERACELALQSLTSPPTYVVENEVPRRWDGTHPELVAFLAEAPRRRVQDPASLASVAAAVSVLSEAGPTPARVLDLCAGRGTKSRQLAAVFPEADIDAWDPDPDRSVDLRSAAESIGNLRVLDTAPDAPPGPGTCDLVVLDVPCSNTGVLARRPGARYRATAGSRASLVALQREIIAAGLAQAAPGGHVLYCTCSIDPEENQQQVQWAVAQAVQSGGGAVVLEEDTLLPLAGPMAHDGSYHALLKVSGG